MSDIDKDIIAFAHGLADVAGAVIRPYFRKPITITDKGPSSGSIFDPVTAADKDAEKAIRTIIKRERPDDAILGEEFGEEPGTSGYRWVLDPVDGTRAFVNGRYEWGSLIALEKDGKLVLGMIDQPVLGERFIGVNGKTQLHTADSISRLSVRSCASLGDAILCSTHPDAFFGDGEWDAFKRVKRAVRMQRWGGDCTIFGILAMGFADLIVETAFHRWDVAALIPVVEGAGGIITNWDGGSCADGGKCVASGDARVHDAALKLLAGA